VLRHNPDGGSRRGAADEVRLTKIDARTGQPSRDADTACDPDSAATTGHRPVAFQAKYPGTTLGLIRLSRLALQHRQAATN